MDADTACVEGRTAVALLALPAVARLPLDALGAVGHLAGLKAGAARPIRGESFPAAAGDRGGASRLGLWGWLTGQGTVGKVERGVVKLGGRKVWFG